MRCMGSSPGGLLGTRTLSVGSVGERAIAAWGLHRYADWYTSSIPRLFLLKATPNGGENLTVRP